MVVSRTPVFVLYYLGGAICSGKPALEIATLPFRKAGSREYPAHAVA
jgi:hypothetical protein